MTYHQIYTDALEVVERDNDYPITIEYKYDSGGKNATGTFHLTEDGARELINALESAIEDPDP